MNRNIPVLLILVSILFVSIAVYGQTSHTTVDTNTRVIDGYAAAFSQLEPGDTIFLKGGKRDFLLIKNIQGTEGYPIVIINQDGPLIIDTEHYFGISIQNCRFFKFTGSGDPSNFYGIRIDRVASGGGLGIGAKSSDYEIDHVSIRNCPAGGLNAKTDPDCNLTATRDKFTQYNTLIHDNYIENVGDEGMYIGSTKYFGQNVNCYGTDTLLMPSLLEGVRVYNNIVEYTGMDGIQVSSATTDCQVFDNMILFDSQKEMFAQMSGITIGGGSKCDCYNNYISHGKGNGIEVHGLGSLKIYNNIIIDPGKDFQPADTSKMRFGIYVTDVSVEADSSFNILFNTIVNPKSDGIRFNSILSRNNLIISNIILNPGNYDYYENGPTSFKGEDSYVMIPDDRAEITIENNFFSRTFDPSWFIGNTYSPAPGSPMADKAYPNALGILSDYLHHNRLYGSGYDIGAIEFNPSLYGIDEKPADNTMVLQLFPNPVERWLTIRYHLETSSDVSLEIYDLKGQRIMEQKQSAMAGEEQNLRVDVSGLAAGIYLYSLNCRNSYVSGKFIKQK
ncbi:MAG: T9SS type A sorting domain-containing protein [Bacteroidetes bacterium]|nr:T9SS type A sorting domain-containing protein [Bacteroidota bacterium]